MKSGFMKIRLLIMKQKIKVFLQFNLITYPKFEPMNNTRLEKFLEAFIMKN